LNDLKHLFEKNRDWARAVTVKDPAFFEKLSRQQKPEYLWIGCADSRVPANQIIDLPPGEVFVHRNIANMVIHTDLNCLSVIQYAVEVLGVKHIIVCGHYGCGGVQAAIEDQDHGLIDNWLRHIRDIAHLHDSTLASHPSHTRTDLLCELNVREQVANVCGTTILRNAWKQGNEISVHGWIYDIRNGIIKDLNVTSDLNSVQ
jgi:carbonic anhydrase